MLARPGPIAAVLAALTALGTSGCRAFDESLLDGGAPVDAPADVGRHPDAGEPDAGCVLAEPPERPGGSDADGDALLFVLRDLVLDQRLEEWRTIGYDRDGLCSVGPEPEIECVPPDETASPEEDGVGGTDNSFGHNLPLFLLTFVDPELERRFEGAQEMGRGVVLLRLVGWNGEDDDPRVDVVLSHAARFEHAETPDGGLPDGGSPADAPRWDGTDVFYGSRADFVAGGEDRPKWRNDNAWVRGRTLVVPLPERAPLAWEGDGVVLTLKLTNAVLTGRISDDGSALEEVTIAGRWAVLDVLDAFEGIGICSGTEDQDRLARLLDESADLKEGAGAPDTPCDSLSIGLRLSGYRAVWGGLDTMAAPPSPCP